MVCAEEMIMDLFNKCARQLEDLDRRKTIRRILQDTRDKLLIQFPFYKNKIYGSFNVVFDYNKMNNLEPSDMDDLREQILTMFENYESDPESEDESQSDGGYYCVVRK